MTCALFKIGTVTAGSKVLRSQIALVTLLSQVALSTLLSHSASAATAVGGQPASPAQRAVPPCTDAANCAAQPLHDEELPWCVSADDPRCAPLHTGAGSPDNDGHGRWAPSAASTEASGASPLNARRRHATPRAGLSPQAGISYRVERPPRATERSLRAL